MSDYKSLKNLLSDNISERAGYWAGGHTADIPAVTDLLYSQTRKGGNDPDKISAEFKSPLKERYIPDYSLQHVEAIAFRMYPNRHYGEEKGVIPLPPPAEYYKKGYIITAAEAIEISLEIQSMAASLSGLFPVALIESGLLITTYTYNGKLNKANTELAFTALDAFLTAAPALKLGSVFLMVIDSKSRIQANKFLGIVGKTGKVVGKATEGNQQVLKIIDNNILGKLGSHPIVQKRFANDVLHLGPSYLKIIAKNPNLLDSWKTLFNAPDAVRRNIVVLRRTDGLLKAGLGINATDINILVQALNKLKIRSISDDDLIKIANYALLARHYTNQYAHLGIEIDLFKQIDLLASSTKFKNPEDLVNFLSKNQLLQNIKNNPGNLEALNETVRLIQQGNEVILEGKGLIKGDIVDLTNKISYQYKVINNDGKDAFRRNIKGATDQFNTEIPPAGYKKVVKIKYVSKNNPDFGLVDSDLQNKLQKYYNQVKGKRQGADLRNLTRIEIENGTNIGTVPHKFKIVNDKVVIIK